jgi:hypothetical protein
VVHAPDPLSAARLNSWARLVSLTGGRPLSLPCGDRSPAYSALPWKFKQESGDSGVQGQHPRQNPTSPAPHGRRALTQGAPWPAPYPWAEGEAGDDGSGCRPGAGAVSALRIAQAGQTARRRREIARILFAGRRFRRRAPRAGRPRRGRVSGGRRSRRNNSQSRRGPPDGDDEPAGLASTSGARWQTPGKAPFTFTQLARSTTSLSGPERQALFFSLPSESQADAWLALRREAEAKWEVA